MRFPKPPYTPPKWYWRLPLRWRQRYCRWVIWKWEAAYAFCTHILSRAFLRDGLPRIAEFTWFCLREDRREGKPLRESIGYLRWYWKVCLEHWLHPLPQGALI